MVLLAEEFRSPVLQQRGSMIDMQLEWYCTRCRRKMFRTGDMLICSNPRGPCGSVLPTDSEEVARRAALSPYDLRDELSEIDRRASHVEAIARLAAPPEPQDRQ